jgi:hypothetical protein
LELWSSLLAQATTPVSAFSVGTFHLSIHAQSLAEVSTDRLFSGSRSGLRIQGGLVRVSIRASVSLDVSMPRQSTKAPTVLTPRRNHIVQMWPNAGGRRTCKMALSIVAVTACLFVPGVPRAQQLTVPTASDQTTLTTSG